MLKRTFLNILKFALAFGLIWWLIESDKLDLSLLKKMMASPLILIVVITLMLLNNGFAAFRWKLILEHKNKYQFKFLKIFKAGWIGLFFNSVLPGSVTGDLIKIFYVQTDKQDVSKKYLLGSVLMDRVIGLFSLICVGAFSSITSYSYLVSLSKEVKNLVHFNLFLLLLVVLTFIMIFWFQRIPLRISKILKSINPLNNILSKLEEVWSHLCSYRYKLLIYLGIGIIVQSAAVCIFWYVVSPYTSEPFLLKHAFTIFPIGMITLAIPIAPGGLGVGHYIFDTLFAFLGFSAGASLFNIYFVILIITNLTGVIPYVLHSGKKVNLKEIN